MDVAKEADDLLPSIDLLFGYNVKGSNRDFGNSDTMPYAAVDFKTTIPAQIEREHALPAIADEKIALAEAILEDEAENYTYGKITLNDYITAVNTRYKSL